MKKQATALSILLGTAFAASTAFAATPAADTTVGAKSLSAGYQVAQADTTAPAEKKKDGKCGEGKCGAHKKKDGKCGEGKCGADKKKDGSCAADKK